MALKLIFILAVCLAVALLSADGKRPLKISKRSAELLKAKAQRKILMQEDRIGRFVFSNLTMGDDTDEGDLISRCQSGLSRRQNRGFSAFGRLVPRPKLNDLGCEGAAPFSCDKSARFRSISGICNNLRNRLWGAADTAFARFVPASYADGIQEPRGGEDSSSDQCETGNSVESSSFSGFSSSSFSSFFRRRGFPFRSFCRARPTALLPAPRTVSLAIHPQKDRPAETTLLFTFFAQLLDHDISFTPEHEEEECCSPEGDEDEDCMPFFAPSDQDSCPDQFFSGGHCFIFARSVAFCEEDNRRRTREQMNGITAFVDASNVYGSDTETAEMLRTMEGGRLLEGENGLLPMLPNDDGELEERAGDGRARENPALTAVHTIFLREHNRLADEIAERLPSATDEQIYQEARRILGAEMQNIVFGQWITALLGLPTVWQNRIELASFFDRYDSREDPTVRNAFATAAFRWGHSMLQGVIQLFSVAQQESQSGSFELRNNFFETGIYQQNGGQGFEEILLGLAMQDGQSMDRFIEDDLTNFLFENVEGPGEGSDLMARNIQRGRDHGLPPYNDFREFCGLPRACSWDRAPEEIDDDVWQQFRTVYDTPADIDLWPAGIAENSFRGGLLGRTFNCLVTRQFQSLKFGDRFFFTGPANPNPFTTNQIWALRRRNLGDILCDTTQVERVRPNVFLNSQELSIECGDHNKLDMDLFF